MKTKYVCVWRMNCRPEQNENSTKQMFDFNEMRVPWLSDFLRKIIILSSFIYNFRARFFFVSNFDEIIQKQNTQKLFGFDKVTMISTVRESKTAAQVNWQYRIVFAPLTFSSIVECCHCCRGKRKKKTFEETRNETFRLLFTTLTD